ncbi:MAG: DUF5678 domain-containing protein [Candidatus Berkelbacteria bacterium]|nr:DUF5678 domain-containing protein [Candidatus Berkelbacteria bacterium]
MTTDWTDLYHQYRGQWVALKSDERTVVGSGATAQQALNKALANGVTEPILSKLPERLVAYVGYGA